MIGPATFQPVHHIGVTVADMERSIAFWERLLGRPGRDRQVLQGPQLGTLVGYPAARIDQCWFDLPGGLALELLQYLEPVAEGYDPGTAHPGNVHICLAVEDMSAAHAHAIASGARPVSVEPIDIARGPRAGTRIAYLRDPDGVTIELHQPPRSDATPGGA